MVLSGATWLKLGTTYGNTPGTLYVSVNSVGAGLGSHTGQIRIAAADPSVVPNSQDITVNLTVTDPGFIVYPSELSLWQKIGTPTVTKEILIARPSKQTPWNAVAVPLGSVAGLKEKLAQGQAKLTVDGVIIDGVPAAAPDWLDFTPTFGTTYAAMTVSVKPTTPAGTYRAAIIVAAQTRPCLMQSRKST